VLEPKRSVTRDHHNDGSEGFFSCCWMDAKGGNRERWMQRGETGKGKEE